jgi:hypothetical protein
MPEWKFVNGLWMPAAAATDPPPSNGDPDGPLVPFPAKAPLERVPPPFPLAAYQALIR